MGARHINRAQTRPLYALYSEDKPNAEDEILNEVE